MSAEPMDGGANGHYLADPPRFTTAEDVNPPLPGDPGYEDYVARRAQWMRWLDEQRATKPGSELAFTPYYDAGLGRMVTPEDPAPAAEPIGRDEPGARVDDHGSDDHFTDGAQGQARPWRRTDAANGELFAQLYGDTVRYDHRRGRWLTFDGHHWRVDDVDHVRLLAKDAARLRYQEASAIEDLGERSREARFAIKSEDRARLEALLVQARAEPPIADAGDGWDLDPWLLGVGNGVVDLRTRRPPATAEPSDRITLYSPVELRPGRGVPALGTVPRRGLR